LHPPSFLLYSILSSLRSKKFEKKVMA
jgi:hypothetical protein